MHKQQAAITNKMTLKERMRFILLCLFSIAALTGALIFFINTAAISIIDIFIGVDAVYYDWRAVIVVLYFPVMGYFEVLVFLFLLLPFTFRLVKLWLELLNIISVYAVLAFFLTLPLSLYIYFFHLADYYSCGLKGPFSGVNYVKDPKMCEQFKYPSEKERSAMVSTSIISEGKKIK